MAYLSDERCKVMGGSDAIKIMQGKWNKLYREKKKLDEVDDLSNVFRVQLGVFTQKFNLEWFIKQNPHFGIEFEEKGFVMPGAENMVKIIYRGHVDAIVMNTKNNERYVFEAKHSSGFQNQERMINYYMPQIQFYLALCHNETENLIFSVIHGNEINVSTIQFNKEYVRIMLDKMEDFWEHILANKEPKDQNDFAINQDSIKIDQKVKRDLCSNNHFRMLSDKYIETKPQFDIHSQVKKELLDTLEESDAEIYNDDIIIKQKNRRRTITIKEKANGTS